MIRVAAFAVALCVIGLSCSTSDGQAKPARVPASVAPISTIPATGSDPAAGLPVGTSGQFVIGSTTYWFGQSVSRRGPNDNNDDKFTLAKPLNVVRRFDGPAAGWMAVTPLPGSPTAMFLAGTVVGDTLLVEYRVCADNEIDSAQTSDFDCSSVRLGALTKGSSTWRSVSWSRATGTPDPVSPAVVSFNADAGRGVMQLRAGTQVTLWTIDPADLSALRPLGPPPGGFGLPSSIDQGCSTSDGLALAGLNGTLNPDNTAVMTLRPDETWSPPTVIEGYLTTDEVLGCTAQGEVLQARDVRASAGGTRSQRWVAVVVPAGGGAPTELPIAVPGAGARTVDVRGVAHPPMTAEATAVTSYDDAGRAVCAIKVPENTNAVYPLPARGAMAETVDFAHGGQTYRYLPCTKA